MLLLLYAALAALWSEPGSDVVLATSGGSPGWLLGPLQPLGAGFADGSLSGPLFYAGLWAALILYCGVLLGARRLGAGSVVAAIVGAHILFALAPPLLSQDAFSYIAYARLDVVHDLNPYTHSPSDIPADPVFPYAGSKDFTSVYGPLFTVATFPLAKTSVPFAFWALKAIAALASLGVVALVWRCASRLGRDPRLPALAVGLNPLVLVHVVGGAHNDALTVLLWMGGVAALLAARPAREALGGALTAASGAVKASAGLVAPFMFIGARRRWALVGGAAAAALGVAIVAVIAFGDGALESLGVLSDNQDRTSHWSLPQRAADGLAALTGGSAQSIVDYTRVAFRRPVRARAGGAPACGMEAPGRRRRMGRARRMGHPRAARRLGLAGALVRDLADAARSVGRGPEAPRREHRVLRLHDGDRHAARALLALLSERVRPTARSCGPGWERSATEW